MRVAATLPELSEWTSPWKRLPFQKLELQFSRYIPKFYNCTKFHYDQMAGKKLSVIKIFKFFVPDHLNAKMFILCKLNANLMFILVYGLTKLALYS